MTVAETDTDTAAQTACHVADAVETNGSYELETTEAEHLGVTGDPVIRSDAKARPVKYELHRQRINGDTIYILVKIARYREDGPARIIMGIGDLEITGCGVRKRKLEDRPELTDDDIDRINTWVAEYEEDLAAYLDEAPIAVEPRRLTMWEEYPPASKWRELRSEIEANLTDEDWDSLRSEIRSAITVYDPSVHIPYQEYQAKIEFNPDLLLTA